MVDASLDRPTLLLEREHYYPSRTDGCPSPSLSKRDDEGRKVGDGRDMHPSILKSGVGIRDDIRKLLKYMVVDEVNGVVDIT